MKIGIFDSGLGGLAILKEILKKLPQYDYVYLGDNARVPYGTRSRNVIYQYTKEAVDFLVKEDCLLIIFACNTASSVALRQIQRQYLPKKHRRIKVLGVVRPVVEALNETSARRVGVIGTRATINSDAFKRELKKLDPQLNVYQKAAPLLVPIIEENEKKLLMTVLRKYLKPLADKNIDALLLGCTHYELIEHPIRKILKKKVLVVPEGKIVAKKLAEYLDNHKEIVRNLSEKSGRNYFVTDLNNRYEAVIRLFLGSARDVKLRPARLGT